MDKKKRFITKIISVYLTNLYYHQFYARGTNFKAKKISRTITDGIILCINEYKRILNAKCKYNSPKGSYEFQHYEYVSKMLSKLHTNITQGEGYASYGLDTFKTDILQTVIANQQETNNIIQSGGYMNVIYKILTQVSELVLDHVISNISKILKLIVDDRDDDNYHVILEEFTEEVKNAIQTLQIHFHSLKHDSTNTLRSVQLSKLKKDYNKAITKIMDQNNQIALLQDSIQNYEYKIAQLVLKLKEMSNKVSESQISMGGSSQHTVIPQHIDSSRSEQFGTSKSVIEPTRSRKPEQFGTSKSVIEPTRSRKPEPFGISKSVIEPTRSRKPEPFGTSKSVIEPSISIVEPSKPVIEPSKPVIEPSISPSKPVIEPSISPSKSVIEPSTMVTTFELEPNFTNDSKFNDDREHNAEENDLNNQDEISIPKIDADSDDAIDVDTSYVKMSYNNLFDDDQEKNF
jgi:hypothetical protein